MVRLDDIKIRKPKQSDLDMARVFINRLVEEDALIGKNEIASVDDEKKYIEDLISKMDEGDAVAYIAEHQAQMIGSTAAKRGLFRQKHVAILDLAIDRDYRGIGLGEKILRLAIDEAEKMKGIKLLDLCSFSINGPAICLYKKLGFEEVARIPNSYMVKDKPVDMIVMHRHVRQIAL